MIIAPTAIAGRMKPKIHVAWIALKEYTAAVMGSVVRKKEKMSTPVFAIAIVGMAPVIPSHRLVRGLAKAIRTLLHALPREGAPREQIVVTPETLVHRRLIVYVRLLLIAAVARITDM